MEGYQVVFEHEVLFRDLDAMGHVNNVAFIAFMEDARMRYWKTLRQEYVLKKINFILAEVSCTYRSPAYLGETIIIGIRARNLGNRSFHFEYRMEDKATGRLIVSGRSIQVMYDYKGKQSLALDETTRTAMATVEQLPLTNLVSGSERPA